MNGIKILLTNFVFCFLAGFLLSTILTVIFVIVIAEWAFLLEPEVYAFIAVLVMLVCIQSTIVRLVLYMVDIGRQVRFVPWLITWSIMAGLLGILPILGYD